MVGASRPGRRRLPSPSTTADQYLAAILDELQTIRSQLVQEPKEPEPSQPRLVREPAPEQPR